MRQSILNDKLIENMVVEVEDGLPFSYTCDLFSVSHQRFGEWMKQGENDFLNDIESIYAKLYNEMKKAYAKYIRHAKIRIKKGESGWQGEAWFLERTNKEFRITSDDNTVSEPVIVNAHMPRNK